MVLWHCYGVPRLVAMVIIGVAMMLLGVSMVLQGGC